MKTAGLFSWVGKSLKVMTSAKFLYLAGISLSVLGITGFWVFGLLGVWYLDYVTESFLMASAGSVLFILGLISDYICKRNYKETILL